MSYGPQLDRLAAQWAEQPRSTLFAPLADALRKAGAIDDALSIARAGVAARPEYVPGHVVLAAVHIERGDIASAEAVIRAGLGLDATHPVLMAGLDLVTTPPTHDADLSAPPLIRAAWMGDGEIVIGDDELVLEDDAEPETADATDEPVLTESLALLYRGQGHLDRALEVFDALVARHPENGNLRARRDAVHAELVASRPRPFAVADSHGMPVRQWLAQLAAAPAPAREPASSFDAFYETGAPRARDDGDLHTFQDWLKALDR